MLFALLQLVQYSENFKYVIYVKIVHNTVQCLSNFTILLPLKGWIAVT